MKLKLSSEQGVSILDILEDVSAGSVPVLRAGIAKLLKSGKNKIILNLIDAKQLGLDAATELLKLHLVATELKGEIALVGQAQIVSQAMQGFTDKPPIRHFPNLKAAMGALGEKQPASPPSAGIKASSLKEKPLPPQNTDQLKAQVAELESQNKGLKTRLGARKADEARKLRFENGAFQKQLQALEEQYKTVAKENKKPFEMESIQVKINQFEVALASLLQAENLLPAKAK